ncbi:MAG: DUF1194 domain-containing protein [Rhizobiales bacterium]|nr:DUF1194 domain-containing protein [Hyphomicrobiales bacterium]MBI3673465.1 DUF1194 domain-containing protein [Hyphomicrobiales bacterium]
MPKRIAAAAAAFLACIAPATADPTGSFDLALVLAVDCSGSVDGGEYRLQVDGIAAAFRDPEVVSAALSGPNRRIAVILMTWGDPDEQKFTTGWFAIDSAAATENFAATSERFDQRSGGGTGIGIAIGYGITLIETAGFTASRKVIDVSGDGTESWELREPRFLLPNAQAMRAARGVIVNGLAIRTDVPDLDRYYRDNVIGGPGAFAIGIGIDNYSDYRAAIKAKLLREIRPLLASSQP